MLAKQIERLRMKGRIGRLRVGMLCARGPSFGNANLNNVLNASGILPPLDPLTFNF